MNKIVAFGMFIALIGLGCSGRAVKRNLSTDPLFRIALSPSIPVEHSVKIRQALWATGKFEIIDRTDGFRQALAEQDRQFNSALSERFEDRERWAHLGKLLGVNGIVVAQAHCYQAKPWYSSQLHRYCQQDLALINANTGKVEVAVAGENAMAWTAEWVVPNWEGTVEKMVESIPPTFQPRPIEPILADYQDQSEELARRARMRAPAKNDAQIVSPGDLKLLKDAASEFERNNEQVTP